MPKDKSLEEIKIEIEGCNTSKDSINDKIKKLKKPPMKASAEAKHNFYKKRRELMDERNVSINEKKELVKQRKEKREKPKTIRYVYD